MAGAHDRPKNAAQFVVAAVIVVAAAGYAWSIRKAAGLPVVRPIRVAVMTWGGAGPGFVGIEKRLFGSQRVELKVIDDSAARQAAYQSEDFEVILTNPDQHPRELEMGLPGSMILLSDVSLGADGVVASPTIKSVADLRGKVVAYVRGAASDFMISKALSAAGLRREDLRLLPVEDPSISVAALEKGQEVAAAVSWEPLMSQAVATGRAKILFTSKDMPDTILGVFVAKDSLTGDQGRLEGFVNGWLRAVDYVTAHRAESNGIMARAFSVTAPEIETMMAGLALMSAERNAEWFQSRTGRSRLDSFTDEAASYWQSVGLLQPRSAAKGRWTSEAAAVLLEKASSARKLGSDTAGTN